VPQEQGQEQEVRWQGATRSTRVCITGGGAKQPAERSLGAHLHLPRSRALPLILINHAQFRQRCESSDA